MRNLRRNPKTRTEPHWPTTEVGRWLSGRMQTGLTPDDSVIQPVFQSSWKWPQEGSVDIGYVMGARVEGFDWCTCFDSPSIVKAIASAVSYPAWVKSNCPVSDDQICITRSYELDTMRIPSGDQATASTPEECPWRVESNWPVSGDQIWIVPSSEPDMMRLPSGEKAMVFTGLCPSKVKSSWPVSEDQIRTVLSLEPDAMRVPSGEKVTAKTVLVCPSRVKIDLPVSNDHVRIVWSDELDATQVPSGEKAMARTKCPLKSDRPDSKDQARIKWSSEPDQAGQSKRGGSWRAMNARLY